MRKFFTFLCAALMSVGMFAATVVTITDSDFPASEKSFTKDGVTVSAYAIDGMQGNISGPGSFSTTLGNFTKIEVSAASISVSGEGWSGDYESQTWTGNASSVEFTGSINGYEEGTTLKFTIEPAPEPEPAEQVITWDSDDNNTFPDYLREGESKTIKGITVTVNQGNQYITSKAGVGNIGFVSQGSNDAFTFSTELGNFTKIECTTVMLQGSLGEGWEGATWTGNANSVNFGNAGSALVVSSITFTIGPAPEPEPTGVTVVYEANGNKKEVEVESFPRTFACDMENGELDGIIKELYALPFGGFCDYSTPTATGNAAVTAGRDGNYNHYITISEAFEGTATVTGIYIKYTDAEHEYSENMDYTLTISVKGDEPTAIENTNLKSEIKNHKLIKDGQLLIERDGKLFNVTGAQVR